MDASRDSAVLELSAEAAACLASKAIDGSLVHVNERDHLQPCFSRAAKQLGPSWDQPGAPSSPRVRYDDWPKLGGVDLALTWSDGLIAFVELKCGAGRDTLDACGWDAVKLAFALARGKASAAYLVAGTTAENWVYPIRGTELFSSCEFEATQLRTDYSDAFRMYERDGYRVATLVPERFRTMKLGAFPFAVQGNPWELRVSRVEVVGNKWAAWPPLLEGQHGPV